MKNKIFLITVVFLIHSGVMNVNAQDFYTLQPSVRLLIGAGVAYNFPITTDYITQVETFNLDVPLNFGIDLRYVNWVSFYTGLEFYYNLHTYQRTIDDVGYTYYINSMFINIPFMAKFYPMYDKDKAYSNFYIGVGGFLNFWPVNTYYVTTNTDLIHTGNCYSPVHRELPPGNIYTPANIGFRFSIGNHFYVTDSLLLGIEMFLNYLFLPVLNGYYFNDYYNRGNAVILEFKASIGIVLSIGIDLTSTIY